LKLEGFPVQGVGWGDIDFFLKLAKETNSSFTEKHFFTGREF